jgi:hypothetical protein
MTPGLGYPAGKPLRKAVERALEMPEGGRKNPEPPNRLGPAWLEKPERG